MKGRKCLSYLTEGGVLGKKQSFFSGVIFQKSVLLLHQSVMYDHLSAPTVGLLMSVSPCPCSQQTRTESLHLGPSMKVFNRVLGGSEKEEPDSSSNCRSPRHPCNLLSHSECKNQIGLEMHNCKMKRHESHSPIALHLIIQVNSTNMYWVPMLCHSPYLLLKVDR